MRLIDADALKKRAVKVIGMDFSRFKAVSTGEINHAPTIDAVPVVRCKVCVHYYEREPVCLKIYSDGNVSSDAWQERKPDDFCSYGERKDGMNDGNKEDL